MSGRKLRRKQKNVAGKTSTKKGGGGEAGGKKAPQTRRQRLADLAAKAKREGLDRNTTHSSPTHTTRHMSHTLSVHSYTHTHTLENEKGREKIKVVYLPLLCRETSVYHRTMRCEPPALWKKGGHVPATWRQGRCRSNSNNLRLFVRLPTGPVPREAYPVSRSASFEARRQFLSAHPR